MPEPTPRNSVKFKDFINWETLRYLGKATWLFFPALLFILAAYACFWNLTQGKDIMVITIENRKVFALFILAQLFWTYMTWYSSRLVAKAKHLQNENSDPVWTAIRVHGPRLLGFTTITIILLAFFQLPVDETFHLPAKLCLVLLVISPAWYLLINYYCERFTEKTKYSLTSISITTAVILLLWSIAVILFRTFTGLVILLFALQIGLTLLLVIRSKIIFRSGDAHYQLPEEKNKFHDKLSIFKKFIHIFQHKEEKSYFFWFTIISFVVLIIYIITVRSVWFSVFIGSFPFVIMAFAVLLFLGNFVAYISSLFRINFHIILLALAYILGSQLEPHYAKLVTKKNPEIKFQNRQNLREYFTGWINDPERKKILDSDSAIPYPVFLAMANGGASRSGYWVASVLSKLEDMSGEKFSSHLLCLSGASGGSVGNAAFFNLLRNRDSLKRFDNSDTAFYGAATDYLESDFLTYTLARMLGPDVFRHILRLRKTEDRAAALSTALEEASDKKSFLYKNMTAGFSEFMTQKNQTNYKLPILCINTTRMQDGTPGVISTIDLTDPVYNKRVDVLDLLDEKDDLKLSTAAVLGASFPYISPAGRIDVKDSFITKEGIKKYETTPQYFVDGGYFDNSGAGVVNEMITLLRDMLENDPLLSKYKSSIQFYILHVSNNPVGLPVLNKVNPLINDLAAPVKTLAGAYNSQTEINDERLKNYMKTFYKKSDHYIDINLYRPNDPLHFSMNWVISQHQLSNIKMRLKNNEGINKTLALLK